MSAGKPTRVVLLAILLIVIASAVPAVQILHDAEANHTCGLCQVGHLPAVQPDCGPSIEAPSKLVERVESYATPSACATVLSVYTPRGPPA